MQERKHILITGTGRAGTTFLVELFTNLGFDTGFNADSLIDKKDSLGRAGLEHDLRLDDSPYVVKDPWFCDYASEILSRSDIFLEHIFIPIRDLTAAAESRRFVTRSGNKQISFLDKFKSLLGKKTTFAGGLWHTNSLNNGSQEEILLAQLYKLMVAVSSTQCPVTLIKYPRSTKDALYLYEKLKPVLKEKTLEEFTSVYLETVKPDLVHTFSKNDK